MSQMQKQSQNRRNNKIAKINLGRVVFLAKFQPYSLQLYWKIGSDFCEIFFPTDYVSH